MLGVLEGLPDCNYDGTTLSFIYGTLLYTPEVTLLGYLITNIPGDLESNPLEESETITENYLVGLIFCSVTVSSICITDSLLLSIPIGNVLGAVKTPSEGVYQCDTYRIALT